MTGREFLEYVWLGICSFFVWAGYACVIVAGLLFPIVLPWILLAAIIVAPYAVVRRALIKEKTWA